MLPVANFYTKFREEEEMDEKGGSEVIFPSKTMKIEKQQQQKYLIVWNTKEAQM